MKTPIKNMFAAYAKNDAISIDELERSVLEQIDRTTLYVATVPTYYATYAIADTESKARKLALKSALAWLQSRGAEMDGGQTYTTMKQVEEWLGCSSYAIPMNGAVQE